jgi:hypothetical protein
MGKNADPAQRIGVHFESLIFFSTSLLPTMH